jgi:flagella basal body P-ring formation protein FlgA
MKQSSAVGRWSSVGVMRMAGVLLALQLSAGAATAQQAAQQVPTAARALPRGYTLTAEDLVYPSAAPSLTDDRQPPTDDPVAPGWVTRRAVRAGEALKEPAVSPPPVVRAGEAVEAVWVEGSIEIRIRGTALGTAAAGQRVAVRTEGRKRIEGVAIAPGEVRINLVATRR